MLASAATLAVRDPVKAEQLMRLLLAQGGAAFGASLAYLSIEQTPDGYVYKGQVYSNLGSALNAVLFEQPVQSIKNLIHSMMDLDPEASKPRILATPAHVRGATVQETPRHDRSEVPPGFTAHDQEVDLEGCQSYDGPDTSVLDKKVHVLYGKPGRNGEAVYIGRTSGEVPDEGYTDVHIDKILRARDHTHHMNEKGFGRAQRMAVSEDPAIIRGLEQLHIEARGGAHSMGGTSSNAINSISKANPKRDQYLEAGKTAEE